MQPHDVHQRGERSVSGLMAFSIAQQLPNGLTPPTPEPSTAPALQARLETIQTMLRTIKQAEIRSGLIPGPLPHQPRRASVGENDLINSPATSGPMAIKTIAALEGPSSD